MEVEPTRLTKSQARKLTDQIAANLIDTWALVEQAAEGRAWEALGYAGWGEYVRAEFGLTPGHVGRLRGQAEVIRALEAAAGIELESGAVTARAAAEVRPVLGEVVEQVRGRVRGRHKATRQAIVVDAVDTARARARSEDNGAGQDVASRAQSIPAEGQIECPRCHGSGVIARTTITNYSPGKCECPRPKPPMLNGGICGGCRKLRG